MGGFDEFFEAHHDTVLRALSLAFGDRSRAEEATQEAFARAYRKWESVSAMERPVAWVYVVAANEARRSWRHHRRNADRLGDGPPAPADDPAGAVATAVTVRALLATLAPRQRTAVVLRYLADLSLAEVAAAMGCAEGTAKSTLHAALEGEPTGEPVARAPGRRSRPRAGNRWPSR